MYIKSLICSLILIGPGSSPAQTKRCRLLLVVLLLVKSIMPSLEPQGCVLCFLKLYYTWSKLLSDVFFICFGMFLSCRWRWTSYCRYAKWRGWKEVFFFTTASLINKQAWLCLSSLLIISIMVQMIYQVELKKGPPEQFTHEMDPGWCCSIDFQFTGKYSGNVTRTRFIQSSSLRPSSTFPTLHTICHLMHPHYWYCVNHPI